MKEKRKISVRRILQLTLTVVAAVCCIIAMVSASSIEGESVLKGMPVVHIKNDRKYHFIEQKEIMDLAIFNRNIDILNTPVSRLDLRGIEQAIKSDPWVADAQVYIDLDRTMHLYVTQRVPVARIFRQDGGSYYIDSSLHTMPLSGSYTYYTTIVTNAPIMNNDSAGNSMKKQIVKLVKTIQADSFWNAQVSQVVIDSAGMFELMPVLGNQRILFGDTTNAKEKLGNLMAFYRNVLNRIGWDKYETLDLRFKDQVIAAPSLPYKGPVDRAIASMNWITSIEITEAEKDSLKAHEARSLMAISRVPAPTKAAAKPVAKATAKNTPVAKTAVAKVVPAAAAKTAAKDVKGKAAAAKPVQKTVAKVPTKPATQGRTAAKSATQSANKTKPATNTAKAKTVAKTTEKQKAAIKGKGKASAAKPVKKAADAKHPAAKTAPKKGAKLPAKTAKKTDSKKQPIKAADKNKKKNSKENNKDKSKEKGKAKYAYPEKKKQ